MEPPPFLKNAVQVKKDFPDKNKWSIDNFNPKSKPGPVRATHPPAPADPLQRPKLSTQTVPPPFPDKPDNFDLNA